MVNFLSRKLEDRSYLKFEFPLTGGSDGNYIEAHLPFLENISISESQKANYAEYSVIGRPGSLFAYLGAKSRSFSLNFNITLPHVFHTLSTFGISDKFTRHYTRYFTSRISNPETPELQTIKYSKSITFTRKAKDAVEEFNSLFGSRGYPGNKRESVFRNIIRDITDRVGLSNSASKNSISIATEKSIENIVFWVNLVRSSSLNNSANTTLGPPIIRINHGMMYNDVPCICTGYSLKPITEFGYDLKTMIPRGVEVSMSLEEVRSNNPDGYTYQKIEDGDSLIGWEAVLESNSVDPGTRYIPKE